MPRTPSAKTRRKTPVRKKHDETPDSVRKPGSLDFEKADRLLTKVVCENKRWLKEMAEK